MSAAPALEVRGVRRRFGGAEALAGIDLEVPAGEFCVVVGPSGCGKSTLLRAVAGLEPVDEGAVRIDGRDVTGEPPRARDVAFVFQSYALYPHLTVRANLEFPLRARGVPRAEHAARIEEAAELLRIGPLLDRKPRALSGGERQRVAIGRAIVRRPKLFLYDEPLSNLDARLRGRMRIELLELHRRLGATSVYVTHDQAEAMTLADRVVVLERGRVRQIGAPRALYDRPANRFVATFLGSPPMSLFRGEVRAEGGSAVFAAGGASLPLEAGARPGPADLGVRAEDLVAAEDGPLALRVRLVEDLGAETLVHGEALGAEAVWRLDSGAGAPRAGETVRLAVRPGRGHLFDAETGERLSAGEAEAGREARSTSQP